MVKEEIDGQAGVKTPKVDDLMYMKVIAFLLSLCFNLDAVENPIHIYIDSLGTNPKMNPTHKICRTVKIIFIYEISSIVNDAIICGLSKEAGCTFEMMKAIYLLITLAAAGLSGDDFFSD